MGFSGWLELKVGTMRHHVGPSITSLFPVTGNLVAFQDLRCWSVAVSMLQDVGGQYGKVAARI